jgi:hypothetical protein
MKPIEPIKADLVANLVTIINVNLAELITETVATCPTCKGDPDAAADCPVCNGLGLVETFRLDMDKLKQPEWGRMVEGFDVKQGLLVPKVRSKDRAFAMLVKLLGLDRAVIELADARTVADNLPTEARADYAAQLAKLVQLGALGSGENKNA